PSPHKKLLPSYLISFPAHENHCHVFFFTATTTNKIYTTRHTLSLHDALPISDFRIVFARHGSATADKVTPSNKARMFVVRSEEHTSELQSRLVISYAVFC